MTTRGPRSLIMSLKENRGVHALTFFFVEDVLDCINEAIGKRAFIDEAFGASFGSALCVLLGRMGA
jgi:hypothetical protein